MAEEQFEYRGKTVEQLKTMNLKEFSEIAGSDVKRKISRGLRHEEKKLLESLEGSESAKTHARSMVVVPQMLDKTVRVYNGKDFVPVEIEEEMLGHRLGEFAKTRREVEHSAPGLGATRSSQHVPLK
jgi:small subunit ribosomal protein S19